MSRDWRIYLDDMLEACRKVERYTDGMTSEAFRADERTCDAVVRNLEIIGEAAKHVPDELRRQVPGIDDDVLWDVVHEKVPALASQLSEFLARTPS